MPPKRYAAKTWAQTRARRVAVLLNEWAEAYGWSPPQRFALDAHLLYVQRRMPRRFDDLDKFDAFVDAVLAATPGGNLTMSFPNLGDSTDTETLKREVAHLARGSKANLGTLHIQANVLAQDPVAPDVESPFVAWWIEMRNVRYSSDDAAVKVFGPMMAGVDRAPFDKIPMILDQHTVPLTRAERRRDAALVRPVRAVDAIQEERESKLTTRAARVGGLWGVLAGLAGGIGGAVVVQIFGG